MSGLEIVALILANAPAAVQTIGEIKKLVESAWSDVGDAINDDMTVEEARAKVLALMDEIKAKSDQIQAID